MYRHLSPTECAKRLYPQAVHLLDSFDRIETGLRNWDSLGLIRVGATVTLGSTVLPGLARQFAQENPGIQLRVTVANGGTLTAALCENRLDLALLESTPSMPDLHTEEIGTDLLCAVMAPNDPLAAGESLTLEQLSAAPLLVREQGSTARAALQSALEARGLPLSIAWESVSTEALLQAAAQGLGVAVLPEARVRGAVASGACLHTAHPGEALRRHRVACLAQEKVSLRIHAAVPGTLPPQPVGTCRPVPDALQYSQGRRQYAAGEGIVFMYELMQVAGNSYYLQSPAKIGLYKLSDTDVCLFDSGNDKAAGRKIRQLLDANGWHLRAIYNTHSHADHTGGNQYLQNQTGCRIYAPGIECDFTCHPVLEPAFLYGGYPCKDLRHKFLMAQESRAEPLTPEVLPQGFELINCRGISSRWWVSAPPTMWSTWRTACPARRRWTSTRSACSTMWGPTWTRWKGQNDAGQMLCAVPRRTHRGYCPPGQYNIDKVQQNRRQDPGPVRRAALL